MNIEIKIMWCKGLTGFNFFQKLSIYASVSIKHEDNRLDLTQQQKQEQRTPVDEEGDGNPEWNHTVTFDLRPLESIGTGLQDLSVVFELRHQGQLFGNKTVGEVRVPLRSLMDSVGCNVTRFVSYEVRSPDGKHNGILDFSYKVLTKENNSEIERPSNNNHTIHISGYNQLNNNNNNNNSSENEHSAIHISGYNQLNVSEYHREHGVIHDQHHQHYRVDQFNSSDSGRIQYPRIDLEDYPPANMGYYPPPPVVYPQPAWGPQGYQPPYFPAPPPPAPPVVYHPHWGYYRPPGNNQPNW